MKKYIFTILLIFTSQLVISQTKEIEIKISSSGGKFTAQPEGTLPTLAEQDKITLIVMPPAGAKAFNKDALSVKPEKDIGKLNVDAERDEKLIFSSFTVKESIDPGDKQIIIHVSYENVRIGEFKFPVQESPVQNSTLNYVAAVSAAKASAQEFIAGDNNDVYYSAKDNKAAFVIDHLGNVLARPGTSIDEDDEIHIYVVAPASIIGNLSVKRTSATRDPTVVYYMGEEQFKENAAGIGAKYEIKNVVLGDFAPGEASVSIETMQVTGAASPAKSFGFVVNRLYAGAFSFGPLYTFLEDNEYGLVSTAQGNVISITESKSPRIHYALTYSPFIFGKMDIQKSSLMIAPFIGASVNNISENAIAGINLGRPGMFHVVLGYHYGRVTLLNEDSGLSEGSAFSGNAEEIPTVTKWKGNVCIGATFDLRAITKIFGSLINPS